MKRNCICKAGTRFHKGATLYNLRKDPADIKIGEHSRILGQLHTFGHGGNISIGDYCYIGENSKIWSAGKIVIGSRVLIAHNVNIFDSQTHPISARKRHKQFKDIISKGHPKLIDLDEKPVIIGDDVWIGCMSIILRGVVLGEGAVVADGSVVTKRVEAWTMVGGNPAKFIKNIPKD